MALFSVLVLDVMMNGSKIFFFVPSSLSFEGCVSSLVLLEPELFGPVAFLPCLIFRFDDWMTRWWSRSIIEFGGFLISFFAVDVATGVVVFLRLDGSPFPSFPASLSFDLMNSEKISDVSLVWGSKSGKECEIPCCGGRPIVIRPGGTFSDRLKLYASASHPGMNFDD